MSRIKKSIPVQRILATGAWTVNCIYYKAKVFSYAQYVSYICRSYLEQAVRFALSLTVLSEEICTWVSTVHQSYNSVMPFDRTW